MGVHQQPWDHLSPSTQRERLFEDAEALVGASRYRYPNRKFPVDCSGFVGAVLWQNGIDAYGGARAIRARGNGVRLLYKFVRREGEVFRTGLPEKGDLIFFSNTYDRNRDGKLNDLFSHVGIVEKIDSDGTVTFLNRVGSGGKRWVLNLDHPFRHHSSQGKLLNSYLRRRTRKDSPKTPYLAGAMFESYGSMIKTGSTEP